MIPGSQTITYTFLHVLISLVEIGSGLIVMFGLLGGKLLSSWAFSREEVPRGAGR